MKPRRASVGAVAFRKRLREWNDGVGVPFPYGLRIDLRRVEPQETEPLSADRVRVLKPGEAQAFLLDQGGDQDRFSFDIAGAGKFRVRVRRPVEVWMRVFLFDDRSGAQLAEWGVTPDTEQAFECEAKGPTRYRILIREWNNNAAAATPGYLLVDTQDRAIPAETLAGRADPFDPTLVAFTRAAVTGMGRAASVELDADGNGTVDIQVPAEGIATFRFPSEGLYRATALLHGANGVVTRVPFWVEAIGPSERKGIRLVVDQPSEGRTVEQDAPVNVRAISFTGARIANVSATVDGRALPTSYTPPYSIEVPWRTLGAGEHALVVTAVDTSGERATLQRSFRMSEYFDLQPADGATLSGNAVRVSWMGGAFGPATVRYRPRGG